MPQPNLPTGGRNVAVAVEPAPRRGSVVVALEGAGQRGSRTFAWPGDLRALLDVIERAVQEAGGESLGDGAPKPHAVAMNGDVAPLPAIGAPVTLEQLERRHIEAVLAGSATLDAAARALGIDSSTLYRKRKAYGL